MTKKVLFLFFIILSFNSQAQTIKEVYDEIQRNHIRYPEIVLRQALLESGWMKSKFYYRTNNLFGFKTRKGYMKYETWQESVLYYYNWQQRHYKDTTETYNNFLRRRGYARNMTSYFRKINSLKVPSFSDDSTHTVYIEPEMMIGPQPEPELKPKKHIHKRHAKHTAVKKKAKRKIKKKKH